MLLVTVFYHSHGKLINIVRHYNHYGQCGLLRKYLQRMSLKRTFKNYQMGWAVAQWYSTCTINVFSYYHEPVIIYYI